ncbi:MAG: hypothetical protein HY002_10620 [Candidatus Rokubacteria bacterium]|nr:hypothetical protein [Candidatus Rokubacteria bacterium]
MTTIRKCAHSQAQAPIVRSVVASFARIGVEAARAAVLHYRGFGLTHRDGD